MNNNGIILCGIELENHLGIKDKVLSEFIIELSKSSKNCDDFRKDLAKNGAEMTETLVERIWNLIQHMQVGENPWKFLFNKDAKPVHMCILTLCFSTWFVPYSMVPLNCARKSCVVSSLQQGASVWCRSMLCIQT